MHVLMCLVSVPLSAPLTAANVSLETESTGFQHSTEVAKSLFKMIFLSIRSASKLIYYPVLSER